MLIIIPTPIGNLKDLTIRALETLERVDGIICEDTRRASILLIHYEIHKPLIVLNDFNESKEFPSIIEKLKSGQTLALISDAGTPLISDPGYKLVRECLAQEIEVDSLPGPSSVTTALTLSGLPPNKFLFHGFLPDKKGHLIKALEDIKLLPPMTHVIFVSPYKLKTTLEELKNIFGDINITLAHELSKIHQSFETKKVSDYLEKLQNPKGEYILLFNPTFS